MKLLTVTYLTCGCLFLADTGPTGVKGAESMSGEDGIRTPARSHKVLPLTPRAVMERFGSIGGKEASSADRFALFSEDEWEVIISGVETGDSEWVKLVDVMPLEGLESISEDLNEALEVALGKNPKLVLELRPSEAVCYAPHPTLGEFVTLRAAMRESRRRLQAVSNLNDEALQDKRNACAKLLLSSTANMRRDLGVVNPEVRVDVWGASSFGIDVAKRDHSALGFADSNVKLVTAGPEDKTNARSNDKGPVGQQGRYNKIIIVSNSDDVGQRCFLAAYSFDWNKLNPYRNEKMRSFVEFVGSEKKGEGTPCLDFAAPQGTFVGWNAWDSFVYRIGGEGEWLITILEGPTVRATLTQERQNR